MSFSELCGAINVGDKGLTDVQELRKVLPWRYSRYREYPSLGMAT